MFFIKSKQERQEEREEARLKSYWNAECNLMASENGLQPYIRQIIDKMDPMYKNHPEITKTLTFAPFAIQAYYQELKEAGASDEIILAAYGQYLWEVYVTEAIAVKFGQWTYEENIKTLEKAEQNADKACITESYLDIMRQSVDNPSFVYPLSVLVSYTQEKHNIQSFAMSLAINYQGLHSYTPVDALEAYWNITGARDFMAQLLDMDRPAPTKEQSIRFSKNHLCRFERYNEYSADDLSTKVKLITEHQFDVFEFAKEFIGWFCDRWTDYIADYNYKALAKPELASRRFEQLGEHINQVQEDPEKRIMLQTYKNNMEFWEHMDMLKYFGYSYDNMPGGLKDLEKDGRTFEEVIQNGIQSGILELRDFAKYPLGCFVSIVTC